MIVRQHFVPTFGLDLETYVERGDVTGAQHLIRYLWAIEVLAERPGVSSLLDLGCGAGYGCFAIARRFPRLRVVGVDQDAEAIAAARRDYALPNLEFQVGDAMRWDATLGSDDYDCVVAFDSIEHFEHRELVLEGVVEHLTAAGCFLLSTPCGWPSEVLRPESPAHRIEYSARGLYDFLARYFRTVRRPEDGSLPHRRVFDRLAGTRFSYLLQLNPALCEEPVRIPNPYRLPRVVGTGAASRGFSAFAGDWDGRGADFPGLFDARLGTATLLQIENGQALWRSVSFGVAGAEWLAVAGDWSGQGRDCLGLYNSATGRFLLFARNAPGAIWRELELGVHGPGWLPTAGRWDRGEADTVGLFDPRRRHWHLDSRSTGRSAAPFVFGPTAAGLAPLAGRWSATHTGSVAIYESGAANFHFRHTAASGGADFIVNYGTPGNLPLAGDWDGDGIDTVGICNLADGCFHLRNANSAGAADASFALPAALRASLARGGGE